MLKKSLDTFPDTTEKPLLGNRLKLLQPKKGYRSAIEPIILASSCQAKNGQKILDLGCGVGTASLCLAERLKNLSIIITGVDCQKELIELAKKNVKLNNFEGKIFLQHGDICEMPHEQLTRGSFDHIITNPPFYTSKEASPSPYKNKYIGHIETTVHLKDWLYYCKKLLKSRGMLTIIYCAERTSELLEGLTSHNFGAIELIPLWPRAHLCAKRILIRAQKCRKLSTKIQPGIILHNEMGYTDIANHLLMEGGALS